MPLNKPSLDVRTFDQLTAEGRRQIPVQAPRWTDHNASDPGITLLELVAWIIEQDFFRLDRVPDETVRAFLRLLNVTPRPAGIAQTVLALSQAQPIPAPLLPRGMQCAGAEPGILFETARPLTVSPATLVATLGVGAAGPIDLFEKCRSAITDSAPFGDKPQPGDAFYLGFDRALGDPGAGVSIVIWRRDPEADARAWAAIVDEWRSAMRERLAMRRPGSCSVAPVCRPPSPRAHFAVETTWEYLGADGGWKPLPNAKDTTRSFSLSGFVRFTVPVDHAKGGPQQDRFFIRCRIVGGFYCCAPSIRGVRLNAVPARNAALTGAEEDLGASRGHASERATLRAAPVVAGSVSVRLTRGAEVDERWSEVSDWDLSGPSDRHYLLESEQGRITFGNGMRGRVVAAGFSARVRYRVGGGRQGNLDALSLTAFPANARNLALLPNFAALEPDLALEQPFAAFGGRAAEQLVSAKARAAERVATADKAVTLADYERLARMAPGIEVARVRAIESHDPLLPCVRAAGITTVVVIPNCPGPRPTPTPEFLGAVAAFLDRRRLVTHEVRVIGPCYDEVAVNAVLHAKTAVDAPALVAAAVSALDQFFHPLHGGPDGRGWQIGRAIYRSEIFALLEGLEAVEMVTGLGLTGPGDTEPRCTNIVLCPDCLPTSGKHDISVQAPLQARIPARSKSYECC